MTALITYLLIPALTGFGLDDVVDILESDELESAVNVLEAFGEAVQLLHKEDFSTALERFQAIAASNPDEPELTERSRDPTRPCGEQQRGSLPRAVDPESIGSAEPGEVRRRHVTMQIHIDLASRCGR